MAQDYSKLILPIAEITILGVVVWKVGQKFGIFSSAASQATEAATSDASQNANVVNDKNALLAFNPNYRISLIRAYKAKYKKDFDINKQHGQLGYKDYSDIAKNIYDSKGVFKDNNNKLYGQIRKLQTQFQLSEVAGLFGKKPYNRDLMEYLKSFLNDEELQVVLQIVKNLPQYL